MPESTSRCTSSWKNEAGEAAIFFLPRDLQSPEMFTQRKPLSATAKRAGWTGFMIDTSKALSPPVRYANGDVVDFRHGPSRASRSK
jgi:hypothetical protein